MKKLIFICEICSLIAAAFYLIKNIRNDGNSDILYLCTAVYICIYWILRIIDIILDVKNAIATILTVELVRIFHKQINSNEEQDHESN